MTDARLLVGVVRKPVGVSGEVAVEPVTDFPDRFVRGLKLSWVSGDAERELTVASARVHGAKVRLRFEGFEDPESAGELSGGDLWVREEEAVPAPEDFYYSHQVEGWRCEDRDGRALGRVSKLERTAGGAMLSVDTGKREPVSVPFTRPIVVSVDAENRRIVLDPPEGLMELS
ncbi:MAG TPA: ribosome maturation factor RimM [Thermoanaerobaculia bacterium]